VVEKEEYKKRVTIFSTMIKKKFTDKEIDEFYFIF